MTEESQQIEHNAQMFGKDCFYLLGINATINCLCDSVGD